MMTRHWMFRWIGIGLFTAIMVSGLAQDEEWTSLDARTSIKFNDAMLRDLGLIMVDQESTASPYRSGYTGYSAGSDGRLTFQAPNGDFETLGGGHLTHLGGFALTYGETTLSLFGFELRAAQLPLAFEMLDAEGNRWFQLKHAHPHFDPQRGELLLLNMDLNISPELANMLGRPALTDNLLGTVDVTMKVNMPEGFAIRGTCVPNFIGDVDVALLSLGTLSQAAREPGGRVSMAPSATLVNVGTADVEWYNAIAPSPDVGQHPFLVLHFYRISDGKMRQIGKSDIKHAFFSVNSGCACPGGHILFLGCGDTYGSGTNLSRFYLAPRDEVTASSGAWKSLGSHFDATPVNDFRDHGSEGHDDYEHRLTVLEPEMQVAGAQYFIEAWYMVKDDINIFNNMGHRRINPVLSGNTWTFAFQDATHSGGATLDAWVDPTSMVEGEKNTIVDTGEGHLQLAVKVTDLGNSNFHYEYALMNLDFDRQIDSFSVPISSSFAPVANLLFNDTDTNPANDWTVQISGGTITWQAPAGNELDWGTLFNFSFDIETEPDTEDIVLSIFEPGSPTTLTVASIAPVSFCRTPGEIANAIATWPAPLSVTDLVQHILDACDNKKMKP